jgi:hypothetical protein
MQIACTKTPVVRQPNAVPRAPGCDTCTSSPTQIDKELILYLTGINWQDRGNGRFECNLIPLIEAQGIKTDSAYLVTIYIGLGRTAIKMDRGVAIDYNGNSLILFGYKLNLQLGTGQVPGLLTIRLELQWI